MILESRFAPCVSTRSMFVIALLAFLVSALVRSDLNDGSLGRPK